MFDSPFREHQSPGLRSTSRGKRALRSAIVMLAACAASHGAFAQMERANAKAMAAQSPAAAAAVAAPANPNMNCTLIVPSYPLTAQGLATPYQLVGTNAGQDGPCNESNAGQSAMVQGAIINTETGQISKIGRASCRERVCLAV